jgi:DNA-directed RNA polymerase specialized sigma24 family protein
MHWRSVARKPLVIDSRVMDGVEEVFEAFDRRDEEGDWWETRRAAMRDCIARLSKHLRAAVGHVYGRGSTLEDAAVALEATREAVGQRLSRARSQIRTCVMRKLETAESHE